MSVDHVSLKLCQHLYCPERVGVDILEICSLEKMCFMQLEEFKRRKAASLASKAQNRPPSGSSTTATKPSAPQPGGGTLESRLEQKSGTLHAGAQNPKVGKEVATSHIPDHAKLSMEGCVSDEQAASLFKNCQELRVFEL